MGARSQQSKQNQKWRAYQRFKTLKKELRTRHVVDSKFVCNLCKSELDQLHFTVDHIIPVSKGGDKYNMLNLQVCCRDCNNKKGADIC
jgi:5-methylcytosine-specific restriction endonuclease McrA